MDIDYALIGKRIAQRRAQLGLKQNEVEERAGIGYKYLSNIERGVSIPSTEVVIRLAQALETTPDAFLVGVQSGEGDRWSNVSQKIMLLDDNQLELAESFIDWLLSGERS